MTRQKFEEDPMLDPDLLTAVRSDLDRWEGYFAWMYLDSVGLVTVGYGTMLPDARAASLLPFFHSTGVAATMAEITKAYDALKTGSATQKAASSKHKFGAQHYQTSSDLIITRATASLLRDDHISRDYTQLLDIYETFDTLPQAAKVALFDMIYNLGPGHQKTHHHRATGLRAFGTMNQAIAAGKWDDAAKHSLRHGIPAERNKAIADMFKSCAPPVKKTVP